MNAGRTLTNGHDYLRNSPANARDHLAPLPYQSTGLMLFNTTGQLLFMNREAKTYLPQLSSCTENGSDVIPKVVLTVVSELISKLPFCKLPKDFESIQVERLCFESDQRFLLRGLCAADPQFMQRSQILIVIERLNQTLYCASAKTQQLYHLTEREQMVIMYMLLGFTNKEIANRLNLSEYTVKEHVKRMMQKTYTNTRTGLLARICFPHPSEAL
jgi:DNA-binding CsgD family transcriptional regulator